MSRGVIWRYYAYTITNSSGFFLPVSVVYLQHRGFGMELVGLTGAAFLFAEVVAEIPTGYVGDRVGRRASLAAGNLLSAAALVGYAVADSALGFVALYVVWAFGWAFRSGTAKAWLYELLDGRGEAGEYARVSGRANTALFVTSAVTAVAAGVLVTVDWSLPFLANAALSALGLPVLYTLPAVGDGAGDGGEATAGSGADSATGADDAPGDDAFTVREAVGVLRLQVSRPEIRWFVAFAALVYALFEVSRTFEQPAMVAAGVPAPAFGALYAGFKLVQAGAASTAGWLEDRLGIRGALALLVPVLGVAYGSLALAPLAAVPAIVLTRGSRSVFRPLRNQYLNDRIEDVGRATVLSGATMAFSLVAGAVKLAGGYVAAATGPVAFLAGTGVALAGVAGLLWLGVSPVRPVEEPSGADAGRAAAD